MSRISGIEDIKKCEIELDVNTEIYEMKVGTNYQLKLTKSLSGSENEGEFDLFKQSSDDMKMLDQYKYVMYGKIFEEKLSEDSTKK